MRLLLLSCLSIGTFAQYCEPDWIQFNGYCYQYHNNRREAKAINYIRRICSKEGSELAPGENVAEIAFLSELARAEVARDSVISPWSEGKPSLALGITRIGRTWNWQNAQGQQLANLPFCPYIGNDILGESCAFLYQRPNQPSCINDYVCNIGNSWLFRYACRRKTCPEAGQVAINGSCQCSKGYFDASKIGGTEGVEVKCISQTPCDQVKGSLSILFVVDSSGSIGYKNWMALTTFLQSGSHLIPNTTRVGFIKYASRVSSTDWIDPTWTESEFTTRVPTKYDEGQTNTAEALRTAQTLIKKDTNTNKVVVLITDGLPYTEEYKNNRNEVLTATKQAAKNLLEDASLVAMGYGAKLHKETGDKFLRTLVLDEIKDYFDFQDEASDLKESHMSLLLGKICNRFVE